MIGALDLAVRADALCAPRWQVRLGFRNIIRKSLADLGIGENPLAVLAGESPTRHASIFATCEGEENTHLCVIFARGELLRMVTSSLLPRDQLQS